MILVKVLGGKCSQSKKKPQHAMDLDEVEFLGDTVPLEVVRILPFTNLSLISGKSLQKTISIVLKLFHDPTIEENLDEEQGTLEAVELYDEKSREQLIANLDEAINKELTTALDTPAIAKKLKKSDRIHIDHAKDQGLFSTLFTGFYIVFSAAVRKRLKPKLFKEQIEKLGFSKPLEKYVTKIYEKKLLFAPSTATTAAEQAAEEADTKKKTFQEFFAERSKEKWFSHVVDVRWRVDVTISTKDKVRLMKPVIMMQFELNNGELHTFETTAEQFASLRYAVANALKEMQRIEDHHIMKIEN